jgi:tRNA pseudouridine55 synthase
MAEGVLLVLANAGQKQREKYLGLPKTYEAEILFGISTDSWDILGVPKLHKINQSLDQSIIKSLKWFSPSALLPVPSFSSVPVNGKPGHVWARKSKKVKMPIREMKIKSIKILAQKTVSARALGVYIKNSIKKVKGDFRQEKILKAWNRLLIKNSAKFQIIKLRIDCESGTYVRSIAQELGKNLKTGAVLFALIRTKVGPYRLSSILQP